MKLTAAKSDLARILARAKSIAEPKHALSILGCVLLSAEDGAVSANASNLMIESSGTVPAAVSMAGRVAVDARDCADLVASLPEGDVTLALEGDALMVRAGKGRYRLGVARADDFPASSKAAGKWTSVSAALLGEILAATWPCMESDEKLAHLAIASIISDGKTVRVVTTDTRRLATAWAASPLPEMALRLPRRAASELRKFLAETDGEVELAVVENRVHVRREGAGLVVQQADAGMALPWAQFIAGGEARVQRKAVVRRDALLGMLRRGGQVADDLALRFVEGSFGLTVRGQKGRDAEDAIDADYAGDQLVVGMSARAFAETIAAMTHDEVSIEAGSDLDPLIVRGVGGLDALTILSPRRVAVAEAA